MRVLCCICADAFTEEDDEICSTICGHIFHLSCLEDWLVRNPNCPQCRAQVQQTTKLYFSTENEVEYENKRLANLQRALEVKDLALKNAGEEVADQKERLAIWQRELEVKDLALMKAEKEAVDQKKRLANVESELEVKDLALKDAEREAVDLKKRLANSESELKIKDFALKDAKEKAADQCSAIKTLLQEKNDAFERLSKEKTDGIMKEDCFNKALRDKEVQISDLRKQKTEAEEEIDAKQAEVESLRAKLSKKEELIVDLEKRQKDAEIALDEKEVQIGTLKFELRKKEEEINDYRKLKRWDAEERMRTYQRLVNMIDEIM